MDLLSKKKLLKAPPKGFSAISDWLENIHNKIYETFNLIQIIYSSPAEMRGNCNSISTVIFTFNSIPFRIFR